MVDLAMQFNITFENIPTASYYGVQSVQKVQTEQGFFFGRSFIAKVIAFSPHKYLIYLKLKEQ